MGGGGKSPWLRRAGMGLGAAVLVGALVHSHQPARRHAAVSQPVPVPEAYVAELPVSAQLLDVALVKRCAPRLQVASRVHLSFVISNNGPAPLPVLDVLPRLPLGGLVERTHDVRLGNCRASTAREGSVMVPAGASVLVTFDLATTQVCPAASPVEAVVRVRRQDHAVNEPMLVWPDLGAVPFAHCDTDGPDASWPNVHRNALLPADS